MNFCVLVKISKRTAQFWYQTEGNTYMPLTVRDSHEVPLYFYVSGNDFVVGNMARDLFYSNNPNTYGNYFELAKDPDKYFVIYNNKKHVKQLFYYCVEQFLSSFINTVLYKSDSIESYRPVFPLRLLFDADIEEKERLLIEGLFTEAGYGNVERMEYGEALFEVMQANGDISNSTPILLLTGIDNTLYIELYKNQSEKPIGITKAEGHGGDPRAKVLSEMVVEYIFAQHPYLSLSKENEIAAMQSYAARLLESNLAVIKGEAVLTDGRTYWFKITEKNLNARLLMYNTNENNLFTLIEDLVKVNSVAIDNMAIVLGSMQINTQYFISRLQKKYPRVVGVSLAEHGTAMKLIFEKIALAQYLPVKKTVISSPAAPPTLPPKKPPLTPTASKSLPTLPSKPASPATKPPLPDKKQNGTISKKPTLPPTPPPKKK